MGRARSEAVKDVKVEHGCILCGATVDLRVGPAGAYIFCGACHWISHPHMRREGSKVHVVHSADALA